MHQRRGLPTSGGGRARRVVSWRRGVLPGLWGSARRRLCGTIFVSGRWTDRAGITRTRQTKPENLAGRIRIGAGSGIGTVRARRHASAANGFRPVGGAADRARVRLRRPVPLVLRPRPTESRPGSIPSAAASRRGPDRPEPERHGCPRFEQTFDYRQDGCQRSHKRHLFR
jgi:hypothetical protein